jgi:hypothetical protein
VAYLLDRVVGCDTFSKPDRHCQLLRRHDSKSTVARELP